MRRYQLRSEIEKTTIKDIEVDGNIVRFINARKGEEGEPSIVIESGVKKRMWIEIGIVGISIGIVLGILADYYDKREYYKTFKRNLKELKRGNKRDG